MRRFTTTLFGAALMAGMSPLLSACGGSSAESATLGVAQGAGPFDKAYRAKNAAEVDAAAFLAALGLTPQQYGTARFDRSLGAVVVEDLVFSAGEGQAGADRAEFYAPDRAAIAAIRAGGEGDLLSPFERLRLYGVTFRAEEETAQAVADAADAADDAEAGAEDGAETGADAAAAPIVVDAAIEGVELFGLKMSPAITGDAEGGGLDAFAFGGATLIGARFESSGEGAGADFKAAKIEIGSYEAGRLGSVAARQGEYGGLGDETAMASLAEGTPELQALLNSPYRALFFPASSRVTFDTLRWDGADIGGLLTVLRRGEEPAPDAEGLITIGGLTVENSVSYIEGRKAATTGKVTVSEIPFIGVMPKRLSMEIKDSVTDYTAYLGPDQSALREVLVERGLDEVQGRSVVDYRYSPTTGDVSLSSVTEAKKLADAALSIEIDGFDHAALAQGDQVAMEKVAIEKLSLVLDDENLLDTVFALSAAGSAQDAATLRQQAVGVITLGALQGSQISPRIPQYAAALSAFLTEGGSLAVELAPEEPVAIGVLAADGMNDPAALIERLNLTVERSD